MNILLIGDEPSRSLWDFYDKSKLEDIDLILSSGDLPATYLSFLETFSNVPLLYVHGNHDDKYRFKPPEGCIDIDDKIYEYQGVRILGLGGSMMYSGGAYQYSEKEMEKRVKDLRWKLRRKGGIDILLTHAPVRGLGDQEDLPHRGFEVFKKVIDKYQPKYMVHGHVHLNYSYHMERIQTYGNTTIINSYEKYLIGYPDKT